MGVKGGQLLTTASVAALPIGGILQRLYEKGLRRHIMVEGGPRTARLFLEAGCVDRVIIYQVRHWRATKRKILTIICCS
jgi:riboflavin biosynthesis pyrimidine reductase